MQTQTLVWLSKWKATHQVRVARLCRDLSPFGSLRSPQRALPTETKVESGTSQRKSGTSVNLSNSGTLRQVRVLDV